jgi:formate/nitrite transporter FocA (FNT family)
MKMDRFMDAYEDYVIVRLLTWIIVTVLGGTIGGLIFVGLQKLL